MKVKILGYFGFQVEFEAPEGFDMANFVGTIRLNGYFDGRVCIPPMQIVAIVMYDPATQADPGANIIPFPQPQGSA